MTKDLKHIAIIMDGNNRWAVSKNLPSAMGHRKGAEVAKKIIVGCLELGIPYLTLYTFSSENMNRSPEEVSNIMEILKYSLSNEINILIENNIRLKIIGDRAKLSDEINHLIDLCEEQTKNNHNLYLQIALNYGARGEIVHAQKMLCQDIISGKIDLQDVNEDVLLNYLYTKDIPDPDLLIRTSGEHRISNFLLWQLAYTELYFTKTLWPNFTLRDFKKAIANFYKRERRYGLSRKI
jgi:undecaprenyl diphosphate synthase